MRARCRSFWWTGSPRHRNRRRRSTRWPWPSTPSALSSRNAAPTPCGASASSWPATNSGSSELIKLASLAAALADALRRRGVDEPAASLTAEAGIAGVQGRLRAVGGGGQPAKPGPSHAGVAQRVESGDRRPMTVADHPRPTGWSGGRSPDGSRWSAGTIRAPGVGWPAGGRRGVVATSRTAPTATRLTVKPEPGALCSSRNAWDPSPSRGRGRRRAGGTRRSDRSTGSRGYGGANRDDGTAASSMAAVSNPILQLIRSTGSGPGSGTPHGSRYRARMSGRVSSVELRASFSSSPASWPGRWPDGGAG